MYCRLGYIFVKKRNNTKVLFSYNGTPVLLISPRDVYANFQPLGPHLKCPYVVRLRCTVDDALIYSKAN